MELRINRSRPVIILLFWMKTFLNRLGNISFYCEKFQDRQMWKHDTNFKNSGFQKIMYKRCAYSFTIFISWLQCCIIDRKYLRKINKMHLNVQRKVWATTYNVNQVNKCIIQLISTLNAPKCTVKCVKMST